MNFRPLYDRVLVRRLDAQKKSSGGLYIPDTASKDKPQEGDVIAVGPGRRTDDGGIREPVVKAGDRVLFGKYTGDEIKLEGEEHVILRESDILAVIED